MPTTLSRKTPWLKSSSWMMRHRLVILKLLLISHHRMKMSPQRSNQIRPPPWMNKSLQLKSHLPRAVKTPLRAKQLLIHQKPQVCKTKHKRLLTRRKMKKSNNSVTKPKRLLRQRHHHQLSNRLQTSKNNPQQMTKSPPSCTTKLSRKALTQLILNPCKSWCNNNKMVSKRISPWSPIQPLRSKQMSLQLLRKLQKHLPSLITWIRKSQPIQKRLKLPSLKQSQRRSQWHLHQHLQ